VCTVKRATKEHLGRIVTESETGIAGFKYSWKKTEATAQDRTGRRKWSMAYAAQEVTSQVTLTTLMAFSH